MQYSGTFVVLAVLMLPGCDSPEGGPDAIVQGTVTIDGMLAERGTVSFFPVDGGPVAIGTIKPDGAYALRVGRGNVANVDYSRIFSGNYIATVIVHAPSTVQDGHPEMPPTPGQRLSAKRFSQRDTSDLNFKVTAGLNILPIEVQGSASDPIEEVSGTESAASDAEAANEKENQEKSTERAATTENHTNKEGTE